MGRYAKMCEEVAQLIKDAGFIVYLSGNREYGFFTDAKGLVVISFGGFSYVARFSGNYSSNHCGSGWVIDDVYPLNAEKVKKVFVEAGGPPLWATKGETVRLHTVQRYLSVYPASHFSKF